MGTELAVHQHVYEAIAAVSKKLSVDGVAKSRKNQVQGFTFRGIDDMYNALAPIMASEGLCILPEFSDRELVERTTAKGGVLFYVTIRGKFQFVSSRDGSCHSVTTYGEAMDSGDKATNKAMSAAYKYACMQAFCIPTEGDNDADAHTHEPVPVRQVAPPPPPQGPPQPPQTRSQQSMGVSMADIPAQARPRQEEIIPVEVPPALAEIYKRISSGDKYAKLKPFQELKASLKELLGDEGECKYYEILERNGTQKSDAFKSLGAAKSAAKDMYDLIQKTIATVTKDNREPFVASDEDVPGVIGSQRPLLDVAAEAAYAD